MRWCSLGVPTTAQIGESLSELVGDERVEQRVEAAVDVEHERGERWYVHLLIREAGRSPPLLPLYAHMMWQHAQRERRHDGGQ